MPTVFKDLQQKIALGLATEVDFQGLTPDDVRKAKSEVEGQVRGFASEYTKVLDSERRVIRYVASTEHRDRMGDRIRVLGRSNGPGAGGNGWDLKHFATAGGPFFFCHRSWEPPIGGFVRVWTDEMEMDGRNERALMIDVEFLKQGQSEVADVTWGLVSGEGMPSGRPTCKGNSVGFLVKKHYSPRNEEERELLDLGTFGIDVLAAELVEDSCAPIPANPMAVSVGVQERSVELALDSLVASGHATSGQVAAWKGLYALGPTDAAQRLSARVRSFVDMGAARTKSVEPAPTAAPAKVTRSIELSEEDVASLRSVYAQLDVGLGTIATLLERVDGESDGTEPEEVPGKNYSGSGLDNDRLAALESTVERMIQLLERGNAPAKVSQTAPGAGGALAPSREPEGAPTLDRKGPAQAGDTTPALDLSGAQRLVSSVRSVLSTSKPHVRSHARVAPGSGGVQDPR